MQPVLSTPQQQHPAFRRLCAVRANDHVHGILPGQERLVPLYPIQGGFIVRFRPGDGDGRLSGLASRADTARQGQDRRRQADGGQRHGESGLQDERPDG